MPSPELDDFRLAVRDWCTDHVPAGWREQQTGASDEQFVAFQKEWFYQLRRAGYAVPHWPREWGGGLSNAQQVVLYQELAAHDAPRLVLAFVAIHHAASTLLAAGSDEQRRRHLPGILDGQIWGSVSPSQSRDRTWRPCVRPPAGRETAMSSTARSCGRAVPPTRTGVCCWPVPIRSRPSAKVSPYLLMDMSSPGIEVRPIRNATGESHFCEIFLDDVAVPVSNLLGAESDGWRVAQATLSAERGMTMLELAERLGNAGFRRLLQACARPHPSGYRPLDNAVVQDRLATLETEITALRALCIGLVERHESGTAGPADASIVKLFYGELLQRTMDFGVEVAGLEAQCQVHKPLSSSWESGAWVLDFIGSWEWTIPGGTSEIQRTIIGERGLGLPRGPAVGR